MLVPKLRFKREDGTDYPEWEQTSLEDVCDIVGGGTPSTKNIDYWNGNIQWFTPSEIGKTKYVSKSVRTISQVGFEKSSARKLPVGTILLTSRATLGEMAIATIECTTNQGFQSLIPRRINGEYLYYLQPTIKNYCNKKACGSTFNEISKGELGKCKIPMPHFEEQQKIAGFLSTVDEVITQSEAEVQNLEQQKKSAMQKIFSQELRFKREDGTDYPEWEEKALSDISEFITKGTTPKKYSENGGVNFVQINSIVDGAINTDKCLRIDEETHNGFLSRSVLFENDILCSIAGALGVIAVVNKDVLPANTNQALAIIRLNEGCNHRYIAFALSSYVMEKYIKQCKTVGAQPNLSLAQIRDMIVPFPCLKEQQKIADFLSAYDEAISYAKQELDKWKELKKGLLQQMLV